LTRGDNVIAIPHARPYTGWLRMIPATMLNAGTWTTSTLDLADELFGVIRLVADVQAEGLQLVGSYSPGIIQHSADRAYRRFAAFTRQAENYYRSAKVLPYRSSALLYYYSFLNLAKAALAVRNIAFNEHHGLTPDYGTGPRALPQMRVRVRRDGVFQTLYNLSFAQRIQNVDFQLVRLLAYNSEISVQYDRVAAGPSKVTRYARVRLLNNGNQAWLMLALPNLLPVTAQPAAVQAAFNARFQQITLHKEIARDLFDLLVPANDAFSYFQSFPGVGPETTFAAHAEYLLSALPGCVHPIYVDNDASDFVLTEHCLADDGTSWPMNEMCAAYLSMFFMGSLIRYHPDVLEELLGTSATWLLESFVNAAPLLFLRTMTSVILNRMITFDR
jgi:YaaC-like Protein